MTEEQQERLALRLGMVDPSEADLDVLDAMLDEAENELLLYLNRDTLPDRLLPKVEALAMLLYRRDIQAGGVKSDSYSEGEQSQSATYLTADDYQNQIDRLLSGVARYRMLRRGDA